MSWVFDRSRSSVEFAVQHFAVSTVRGAFLDFDATIAVDLERPERSHIRVVIQGDSLVTDNSERDVTLRSSEFLDTVRFPTLTFESSEVAVLGGQELWVRGNLTLHGTTKEVVLTGRNTVRNAALTAESDGTASLTLNAVIDRRDFFDAPLVGGGRFIGATVVITVHATLRRAERTDAPVAPGI